MTALIGLEAVEAWDGVGSSLPPCDDVTFKILEVKQSLTSKAQKPQLEVKCEVADCAQRDLVGRQLTGYYNLDNGGTGTKRLRNLVESCGLPLQGVDDQHLIGRYFLADVINETYDRTDAQTGKTAPKTSSKIVKERPLGGSPAAAPQPHAPAAPQPAAAAPAPAPYAPPQAQAAPAVAPPPQAQPAPMPAAQPAGVPTHVPGNAQPPGATPAYHTGAPAVPAGPTRVG